MDKTRQEMIDALINSWVDIIRDCGPHSVEDSLRHGFKGYNNLSDERLLKEYNDLLEEQALTELGERE